MRKADENARLHAIEAQRLRSSQLKEQEIAKQLELKRMKEELVKKEKVKLAANQAFQATKTLIQEVNQGKTYFFLLYTFGLTVIFYLFFPMEEYSSL